MIIEPVEQRRASEVVRLKLIELIETGEFDVGDRLPSEADLARAFSVSRSVIREALHSLGALGLTESFAGKGTFVAANKVSTRLLLGRYLPVQLGEVRKALEIPSARLAADRRTEQQLESLGQCLRAFEAASAPAQRVRIDADFHIGIAEATNNPLFPRLIEDLREVLQEQALFLASIEHRREEAVHEHAAIYDAISAGDGEAAAAAMDVHLSASVGRLADGPP